MGCVSSTLLNQDEEFPQIGFRHHIVSLTSTTYGLLTLDNPPPPPSDPQPLETINSWELMSGLDSEDHVPSFRYMSISNDENANPNVGVSKKSKRVVLYITSLRGVRKTFEDCEAVRSAIRGLGIPVYERDISMDRGFRDELRELMKGKGKEVPPRLFVDGRYVGGVEEVMKIVEQQGSIAKLLQLQGLLPISRSRSRSRSGQEVVVGGCACEGCGGVGFLPCFTCHGSCKIMKEGYGVGIGVGVKQQRNNYKRCMVLRCSDCNENGLVLCPICS